MSDILQINGAEYHPAPVAAKQLGYTKEYLLMLAKQGKIKGQKISNRWYIHIPSVEQFFSEVQHERKDRRQEISLERKRELQSHTEDRVAHAQRTKRITRRSVAVLETLTIVVIGFMIGTTSYVGVHTSQQASVSSASDFVDSVSLSFYRFVIGESEEENLSVQPDAQPDSAWSGAFVHSPVQAVQDSFSDPVNISFDEQNPSITVVSPVFKDGEGDPHRFLLTPVEVGSSTSTESELNQ